MARAARNLVYREIAKVTKWSFGNPEKFLTNHGDDQSALATSEADMKVYDIMSSEVQLVAPDDSIQVAAQKMADADVGKNPANTLVREIMTDKVLYCSEDEDVEEAADAMSNLRIRRLPIVDDDMKLVGVLSLGDIAFKHKASIAGTTLVHVCDPHGNVR